MPGPSDIRVNPFNNATNYVNLTERHIVPSVSPFVVRLNEVPEKQDPSNMQMYYVDDTTGQTTETALTEVAATPGAGEFRPDYSTNAFDDTSWNTGLIEFSSADAGKIIEVSYTATGTLAGVKTNRYPAWWLDRGDGSDGDFVPESNVTISGLKQYKSVFIKAGVTVTVNSPVCRILCQTSFINQGNIKIVGVAGNGGASAYSGMQNGGVGGSGYLGGSGGAGAKGSYNGTTYSGGAGGGTTPALSYSEENKKALMRADVYAYGAGGGGGGRNANNPSNTGGSGGSGGGTIKIICKEFHNTGSISANGGNGQYGTGGGGGGGSVQIIAGLLLSQGTLTANGGSGANSGGAGWTCAIEIGSDM